jgi:hypothetical protein
MVKLILLNVTSTQAGQWADTTESVLLSRWLVGIGYLEGVAGQAQQRYSGMKCTRPPAKVVSHLGHMLCTIYLNAS